MKEVLSKPIKKLFENSLLDFKEYENMIRGKIGLNAENDIIEDLSLSGIYDSTKVLKEIIKNSISVSMMLLSTDVLVVNKINNTKIDIDSVI